ncbi:MAG TPA: hypothetical protein VFL76_09645 [Edaphocola sp.]|nr:hypothetical protein [Edaphocola sp.]
MFMKLLLPHRWKNIGWTVLGVGVLLSVAPFLFHTDLNLTAPVFAMVHDPVLGKTGYFSVVRTDISFTLTGVLFLTGALLVAFSKEKNEDEYISSLRLSSLLWAVLVNYLLLLFAFLFIYGIDFLMVMTYNMFTVLLIFIIRFNYVMLRNKSLPHEK